MRVQTETGQLKLTLKDLNDRGSYQENSTPKRARHEKIHFCSGSGRYVPVSSSISADDDEILDFLPAILSGVKANPPTPPPTPPKPTPPHLPPGVTVLPTQSYLKDYSGDLQIVGEIYNNTTSSIKYVEINANVFNGTSLVATDFTYTVRDLIPPKTKACFKIYTDYPGAYTRVDFEPVSYWNTSDRQPSLSLSWVYGLWNTPSRKALLGGRWRAGSFLACAYMITPVFLVAQCRKPLQEAGLRAFSVVPGSHSGVN